MHQKVTSKAHSNLPLFFLSSRRVALVVEKASSSPPQSNGSSQQQYIKEEPFFAFSFASLRASFKGSTFLSYSIWTITKPQTPLSSKIYTRIQFGFLLLQPFFQSIFLRFSHANFPITFRFYSSADNMGNSTFTKVAFL